MQQALFAGDWETTLKAAEVCIKLDYTVNPLVQYGAGMALQQLGRHEEAVEYFDLLLKQDPKHELGILCAGTSYKAVGNVNAARELMVKAIGLSPRYVPGYVSLANLEIGVNNLDAARKVVLDALKIVPTEASLYDLLLQIELTRDNRQQATVDAMRGLEMCPTGGEGMWHRLAAVYLAQTGEVEAARAMLESGLKVFPDDPDLIRVRGMV
jgi:tetratricopeptide (TPR) repeat protein